METKTYKISWKQSSMMCTSKVTPYVGENPGTCQTMKLWRCIIFLLFDLALSPAQCELSLPIIKHFYASSKLTVNIPSIFQFFGNWLRTMRRPLMLRVVFCQRRWLSDGGMEMRIMPLLLNRMSGWSLFSKVRCNAGMIVIVIILSEKLVNVTRSRWFISNEKHIPCRKLIWY